MRTRVDNRYNLPLVPERMTGKSHSGSGRGPAVSLSSDTSFNLYPLLINSLSVFVVACLIYRHDPRRSLSRAGRCMLPVAEGARL